MAMDGLTLTLLTLLHLTGKVSSIPHPVNVTVSCRNFQTVVYWNYSQPSVNTRFTVDVRSYGGGRLSVHGCVNTTSHHCDVSSLVLHALKESYSYRVKAVEGSVESVNDNHAEFTYNTNRVEDVLCSLDFPPVSLTVSQGILVLRFLHPFHLYKAALLYERNKRNYKRFDYQVLAGKEGVIYSSTCLATEELCEQRIHVIEEEAPYCISLKGKMNDLNVIAAERICHEPQKNSEKMNHWYIVLCAVVPFVIVGVVAVFGLLVFKKLTEDKSSFPKLLISVFGQRSAGPLLRPESEITSEVQSLAPSPNDSVLVLPTDFGYSDAPTTGEGSRFHIGGDMEGQNYFPGSGGSGLGSRDDEEQGEGLSGIQSSGYDRPQVF